MDGLDYPTPDVGDEVVRLRRWTHDDLGCIAEASSDPRIPAGTTVPAQFTEGKGRAYVERQWSRRDNGEGISLAMARAHDDVAVGLLVLLHRPQVGNVGLGYWVVPSARRGGLATRAVRLASEWALTLPDVARIEAWIEPDNVGSQRVVLGAGFELEGRLRSFLVRADGRADALVYSRVSAHG